MNLLNKKILVTGADGFIGSHLTEMLVDSGFQVRAFVYYNSFNSWGWLDTFPKSKLDKIEIFAGDIRDPNGVRNAMANLLSPINALASLSKSRRHTTVQVAMGLLTNSSSGFSIQIGFALSAPLMVRCFSLILKLEKTNPTSGLASKISTCFWSLSGEFQKSSPSQKAI